MVGGLTVDVGDGLVQAENSRLQAEEQRTRRAVHSLSDEPSRTPPNHLAPVRGLDLPKTYLRSLVGFRLLSPLSRLGTKRSLFACTVRDHEVDWAGVHTKRRCGLSPGKRPRQRGE